VCVFACFPPGRARVRLAWVAGCTRLGFALRLQEMSLPDSPGLFRQLSRGAYEGARNVGSRLSGNFSASRPEQPPPAPASSISKAGADLMLLLLRANIPSGEMLGAKTDREMALLAIKYGIELPRHLAHLPTLPPPKSAEEKEALSKLAAETEAADSAHASHDASKIKERPPRRMRMRLGHASDVIDSPQATPQASPQASPAPSPRSAQAVSSSASPTGKASIPGANSLTENDLIGGGMAIKEKAPTARRGKKTKKKDSKHDKGQSGASAAGIGAKLRDGDFRKLFSSSHEAPGTDSPEMA